MIATIATVAGIMWKLLFSDRSGHANHMETSLYGTAQRSKSQRPFNFFGSDCSDHVKTSLYIYLKEAPLFGFRENALY